MCKTAFISSTIIKYIVNKLPYLYTIEQQYPQAIRSYTMYPPGIDNVSRFCSVVFD